MSECEGNPGLTRSSLGQPYKEIEPERLQDTSEHMQMGDMEMRDETGTIQSQFLSNLFFKFRGNPHSSALLGGDGYPSMS